MIIQPRIRGFICTSAHPKGCLKSVEEQMIEIKSKPKLIGPRHVLVIGASTGYGLSSAITSTFLTHAKTIGVFFEKEADERRTASPGYYNFAAYEEMAKKNGFYVKGVMGDAFSNDIKKKVADLIEKDLKQVDLIIYSVASPRRIHPETGQSYTSVLKPIAKPFEGKSIDAFKGELKNVRLEPATSEEINNTIAVMGGEDWQMWIDYLDKRNLLADKVITVAYSYIGPSLTHAIYKEGTIGKAKEDLKKTADHLQQKLGKKNGHAFISVNKAVVTQASAAIPVVPLYISLLFKVMKKRGIHENCIQQIYRLFKDHLYHPGGFNLDEEGYIRLDDLEMKPEVQEEVALLWEKINADNLLELSDLQGYREDFYHLFGFHLPDVNYNEEVDPIVKIESL